MAINNKIVKHKDKEENSNCQEYNSKAEISHILEFLGEKSENRKIYLFSPIETESILEVIVNIHYLESKSNEDIELYINSDGGYIDDCMALIDTMNSSPCDIKTIVLGRAASAACLIASNGTPGKRYAGRNSEFMYHESMSSLPCDVKPSEMIYYKMIMDNIEGKCNKIFAQNTGQDLKVVKEIFIKSHLDKWMTASQAKKFGMIDKMLTVKRRGNVKDLTENDE